MRAFSRTRNPNQTCVSICLFVYITLYVIGVYFVWPTLSHTSPSYHSGEAIAEVSSLVTQTTLRTWYPISFKIGKPNASTSHFHCVFTSNWEAVEAKCLRTIWGACMRKIQNRGYKWHCNHMEFAGLMLQDFSATTCECLHSGMFAFWLLVGCRWWGSQVDCGTPAASLEGLNLTTSADGLQFVFKFWVKLQVFIPRWLTSDCEGKSINNRILVGRIVFDNANVVLEHTRPTSR